MKLSQPNADCFVPDDTALPEALARTTHLCIGAHQDDQEFMAYHGIAECFQRDDRWFTGVTVTNGGGSARGGPYAAHTDEQMIAVRRKEQRKAAVVGEYACQVQLDFPSSAVKDPMNGAVVADLQQIVEAAKPGCVYLHNPADKHDTHVAVLHRALAALRSLAAGDRPARVWGCEVWRSLDWLLDDEKQVMPVSAHPNLAASLSGVFDSQIVGGKRYDAAVAGRRMANATFYESHATDEHDALAWAIDLTPLVHDPSIDLAAYTRGFIERFAADVETRIRKFGGS